ncbi:winged helix-turn-helix transcriptional regulator [Mediterraneibacter glycyrrhizinilyticus]|uniref:winged helix-turn-helix transcriptional regulator n=1 Tax=Mediterraneibacter glycyrrhizinilyticus TaxID=342942 RepID=UPI003A7F4D1B
MDLIRKNSEITAKEIARCLGCSLSGAQYKLKVLKKDGRIRFNGKGGKGRWEILR